ncbi:hypothetical protein H2200_000740 [Cladophialophora chaetospira]|uniref:non-specific serine/threonine protein kinase n=1 Tax=Cladophialophora chaetospira TaxID=386627 RepID=A0AA39CPF9_9EURO|nr:hypothetical protein H2200_000740 [Cladophialophora chaetospira]
MAQQRFQGVRMDEAAYEVPDLDNYRIARGGRPSRHNQPRTLYERLSGKDFDPIWYTERDERGALGVEDRTRYGQKIRVLLTSLLFFHSSEDEDGEWGPIRPLGAGGFGTVGLFQKRDKQNNIVDEVVCKEIRFKPNKKGDTSVALNDHEIDSLLNSGTKPKLAIEAAIHRDINVQHPGVAPHLRGYKVLEDHLGDGGKHHALRDPPPADSKMLLWPERGRDYTHIREKLYCLHLDMKPSNVLLGYPHKGDEYPSALTSDFGVAAYTTYSGEGPKKNPDDLEWRGTKKYKLPEQTHYGYGWDIAPDEGWMRTRCEDADEIQRFKAENLNRKIGRPFEPSMNIYGVGQTIFELVTLIPDYGHLHNIRARSWKKYRENGNHQIKESDISTWPSDVYSAKLRGLVHRCLDPTPAKRPTPLDLLHLTRQGLREATKSAATPPRVYYRDHEIQDMPLGDAMFDPVQTDFVVLVRDEFVNPDFPALKLPREKFDDDLLTGWGGLPNWKKFYRDVNPHRRWFQPVGNPAPRFHPPEENGNDYLNRNNAKAEEEDAEILSVSSDSDDSNDGDDHGQGQIPNEEEQIRRAEALSSRVERNYFDLITPAQSEKLLRTSAWDVQRAGLLYGEKLGRAEERGRQQGRRVPLHAQIERLREEVEPYILHDHRTEWLITENWLRGCLKRARRDLRSAIRYWKQDYARYFDREGTDYSRNSVNHDEDDLVEDLRRRVQHVVVRYPDKYRLITNRWLLRLLAESPDGRDKLDHAEQAWYRTYEKLSEDERQWLQKNNALAEDFELESDVKRQRDVVAGQGANVRANNNNNNQPRPRGQVGRRAHKSSSTRKATGGTASKPSGVTKSRSNNKKGNSGGKTTDQPVQQLQQELAQAALAAQQQASEVPSWVSDE